MVLAGALMSEENGPQNPAPGMDPPLNQIPLSPSPVSG